MARQEKKNGFFMAVALILCLMMNQETVQAVASRPSIKVNPFMRRSPVRRVDKVIHHSPQAEVIISGYYRLSNSGEVIDIDLHARCTGKYSLYSQSYEPSEGKVYCIIFYRDGYFVNSFSVFV